jgi:uncharacterized protein
MERNPRQGLWTTVLVLSVIGAINWGLIGFFNWNLVDAIFGGATRMDTSAGSRVIYSIVGIAGLVLAGMAINRGREGAPATTRRTATATP